MRRALNFLFITSTNKISDKKQQFKVVGPSIKYGLKRGTGLVQNPFLVTSFQPANVENPSTVITITWEDWC